MREKKVFCVYGYFSVSCYIKEGEKSHFVINHIIILCKYKIVVSDTLVDSFLDELFLLFAVMLSGLHEKTRRNKDWVTGKSM